MPREAVQEARTRTPKASRPLAAGLTIGPSAAYVAGMFLIVRPLLARFARWQEDQASLSRGVLASVCVLLLVSALITEAVGIHAIFGAFVLGAVITHDSSLAASLKAKLEDIVVVFFLTLAT